MISSPFFKISGEISFVTMLKDRNSAAIASERPVLSSVIKTFLFLGIDSFLPLLKGVSITDTTLLSNLLHGASDRSLSKY